MIRGGDIEQWPGTQGRRRGSPQRHLKGETSGNQEDCSCSLVCGVPCRSSWPTCSPARHSVLPPRLPASPASSRCLHLTISVHRCSRSSPPGRFPVGLSAHIPKGRNLMALLPLLWPASWSSAFWPCVLPSLSQLQLGEQSHLEFFKLRVRTHTRIHTIM